MKRLLVTWTTVETVEWEAVIEVADDFDPAEELHGDSQRLIDVESPNGGELIDFHREVEGWSEVEG